MTIPDPATIGYSFLDSGNGQRLEQFGNIILNRPAPRAEWSPRLAEEEWQKADATYQHTQGGEGEWCFSNASLTLDHTWVVTIDDITFNLHLSSRGQVGLFPEQFPNWRWLRDTGVQMAGEEGILNGFAHTGAATLFAVAGGAGVVHLDSAKSAVARARENAVSSGLADRPVRWIVDDASSFMAREERRGNHYGGIILDPPAFGRGSKGKRWKLEKDLPGLLQEAQKILRPEKSFLLLTCHSPEWSVNDLSVMVRQVMGEGEISSEELTLRSEIGGHELPRQLMRALAVLEPAMLLPGGFFKDLTRVA